MIAYVSNRAKGRRTVDGHDLSNLKLALRSDGPERSEALDILLDLSTSGSSVALGSAGLGLLPLLCDVVTGPIGQDQVIALSILHNLSTRDENHPGMTQSIEVLRTLTVCVQEHMGLRMKALEVLQSIPYRGMLAVPVILPSLITIVTNDAEASVAALLVLKTFSSAHENMGVMTSPRFGLLLALKVVIERTAEERRIALEILVNVSSADKEMPTAVYALPLVYGLPFFPLPLLPLLPLLLMEVYGNNAARIVALLNDLQEVGNTHAADCRKRLAAPDLALLPLLKSIVEKQHSGEARLLALKVLENLCAEDVNKLILASHSLGLLPALMKIMCSDDRDLKVLALKIVSLLSQSTDNQVLLASNDLGLWKLLNTLAADNRDRVAMKLAITIRNDLSEAARVITAATVRVWAAHGVFLELFIACILYQISVLDDGIKEQSSKRLVGLDAHAKLTTKKLKLETDCAFALKLHRVLPQSFCLLIGSESQACWIKSRLDDHAAWLMNQSTNKMLSVEVAFSRFVASLPSELRGARCDESADLASVLKGISSLRNNLSNEFREMKDKLSEMAYLQRTQLSMLAYLQAYKFPHSFILIPCRPGSSQQTRGIRHLIGAALNAAVKALAEQMFNTLYLFFYCPVTGKLVRCGKNGEGYALSSLKGWVKQLLPIVRAGLFMAKIVLSTQGLGGLIPSFPNSVDQDHLSSMLDDLTVGVEKTASALEGITTTDSLEDCIISSLKDELMDGIVVAVAKEDGVQNVADIRAYRPKNSGLVQAQYAHTNGAITYVWVSTEGRAAFELQGPAAFNQLTWSP